MPGSLVVTPAEFTISGADQLQRVLVQGPAKELSDGRVFDYSRQATYSVSNPKVVTASLTGMEALGKPSEAARASLLAVLRGKSASESDRAKVAAHRKRLKEQENG